LIEVFGPEVKLITSVLSLSKQSINDGVNWNKESPIQHLDRGLNSY